MYKKLGRIVSLVVEGGLAIAVIGGFITLFCGNVGCGIALVLGGMAGIPVAYFVFNGLGRLFDDVNELKRAIVGQSDEAAPECIKSVLSSFIGKNDAEIPKENISEKTEPAVEKTAEVKEHIRHTTTESAAEMMVEGATQEDVLNASRKNEETSVKAAATDEKASETETSKPAISGVDWDNVKKVGIFGRTAITNKDSASDDHAKTGTTEEKAPKKTDSKQRISVDTGDKDDEEIYDDASESRVMGLLIRIGGIVKEKAVVAAKAVSGLFVKTKERLFRKANAAEQTSSVEKTCETIPKDKREAVMPRKKADSPKTETEESVSKLNSDKSELPQGSTQEDVNVPKQNSTISGVDWNNIKRVGIFGRESISQNAVTVERSVSEETATETGRLEEVKEKLPTGEKSEENVSQEESQPIAHSSREADSNEETEDKSSAVSGVDWSKIKRVGIFGREPIRKK